MWIFGAIQKVFCLDSLISKHDDQLGVFETEESYGLVRGYFPRIAMKLAKWRSASGSDTDNTTVIGSPGNLATSQTAENDGTDNEHRNATMENHVPLLAPSPKENTPSMHNLAMIGKDDETRKSTCSDVINKYQKLVWLTDSKGERFRVSVQFDTGAASNFITRGTLSKNGSHKEYSIPPSATHAYYGPLAPNTFQTPMFFVYVKMDKAEVGFHDRRVKLKIIEDSSECQIIIGRNTMAGQRGEDSLIARLERSNDDFIDGDISRKMVSHLFKASRTKDQKAADAARDLRTKNQTNQAFSERQAALQGTPYGTANAHWNGSWPAPQNASADTCNQQAAPFRQDYPQTTNIGYAPQIGVNRRDTDTSVLTQSTQYSQYSMEGPSIASSRTSCSHDSPVVTLPWKATGPQPPQDESTQYAGEEDSPRRT
ncbi:hypothetical protein ACEPPN_010397 [Leptodophora sp. 'Broadleaf-Isolate-01']